MTSQTESQFQSAVIDLAETLRWKVGHFHDSRREVRPGIFVGDKFAAGFPDLIMARDRIIYAELKRAGKEPSAKQVVWLDALTRAGAECYVWRAEYFAEITKVLRDKHPPWPAWIPESLWKINPP